jgi:hypothetical protein
MRAAEPDVVVIDPMIGINADFDLIDAAMEVGAKVIVFSRARDTLTSGRYDPEPSFVVKPYLSDLEEVIERLRFDPSNTVSEADRRQRPARVPNAPVPTGPNDAAAFYAALNEAVEGDALVAIAAGPSRAPIDPSTLAAIVSETIRGSDRLLIATSSLLVLLPGGGEQAIDALHRRTHDDSTLSAGIEFRSIVVAAGESPTAAFDRLKQSGESIRS